MKKNFLFYFTIIIIIAGTKTLFSYLDKLERRFNSHTQNIAIIEVKPPYVMRETTEITNKYKNRITVYATKDAAKKAYIGQKVKIKFNEKKSEKTKKRNKKTTGKIYHGKVIFISRVNEPVPGLKGIPDEDIFMSRKIIIETATTDYNYDKYPNIILAHEIETEDE